MKPQGWAFSGEIVALVCIIIAVLARNLPWVIASGVILVGAAIAARVLSRKDPGPMPYAFRWVLLLPRGPQSPRNLERILKPRSGERILEIGPGIGTHALPISLSLFPGGTLVALEVQQQMIDELSRRAARAGITNIVATRGDARALPYADHTFDAAYLIGVLGEVPDRGEALSELTRVLKPAGRLVTGEVVVDPDYIPLERLKEDAGEAGLIFERMVGLSWAYLACFRSPSPLPIEVATTLAEHSLPA